MKAAGEALSQVVHNFPDPDSMPLVEGKDIDNSILCCVCGKWRVVPKAYKDRAQHIDGWHCGIKGSPVASPKKGRWVMHAPIRVAPKVSEAPGLKGSLPHQKTER